MRHSHIQLIAIAAAVLVSSAQAQTRAGSRNATACHPGKNLLCHAKITLRFAGRTIGYTGRCYRLPDDLQVTSGDQASARTSPFFFLEVSTSHHRVTKLDFHAAGKAETANAPGPTVSLNKTRTRGSFNARTDQTKLAASGVFSCAR